MKRVYLLLAIAWMIVSLVSCAPQATPAAPQTPAKPSAENI
ncbi:MAG: hypothetical protein NZ572_07535 [Thermoflexus sp.]|nr:hypothetical protein [Thermoflexus sp.]